MLPAAPLSPPATNRCAASLRRVWAVILRHLYLWRGSWPRLIEMGYWPTMGVIIWGYTTEFFRHDSSLLARAGGALLGGVLLWEVLFRSQIGVSVAFLEEMWSRNLGHLFVSPLRPAEWMLGMVCVSMLRALLAMIPAVTVAYLCYRFSIFSLGFALIPFVFCLAITGWAVGLVINGVVLRYGMGAEAIAWAAAYGLSPLSAVFYPVSVLPPWAQAIALAMPPAHIFEGMRAVMLGDPFPVRQFWQAMGLNVIYLGLGAMSFLYAVRRARVLGKLLQTGE